jgi:hypothetical protein
MNFAQLLELLAVAAVVLLPVGAVLGSLLRAGWRALRQWLPPRHMTLYGARRRGGGRRA